MCCDKKKGDDAMKTKNICGKIPVDLHSKVRTEIEEREISTQQFLQQIIEEHFMKKGVSSMEARTIAVQVTDELFNRLKTVVAWKGCKQKEFLISIIESAIAEVESEMQQESEEEPQGNEEEIKEFKGIEE